MDIFSWAMVIVMLLSLPVTVFIDRRNMEHERFKRRAEKWMRDLKNNPWHLPLDPNADTTRWPNLIVVGSVVWALLLLLAIGQCLRRLLSGE